jgi:hypothetical protein
MDVRTQAGRQAETEDLHDASEGIAVGTRSFDLGDHPFRCTLVEAPDRRGIDRLQVVRTGKAGIVIDGGSSDAHDVRENADIDLGQEGLRHRTYRGTRRGLPGAGAF